MKQLILGIALLVTISTSFAEDPPTRSYPLKTCLVSNVDFEVMGEPITFVYHGQEIKLCCDTCKRRFDKEPEKYLKKLEPN